MNEQGAAYKRTQQTLVASGLVVSLLSVALILSGVFDQFEARSYDYRTALIADSARADRSIKVIAVDQHSLDVVAQDYGLSWPWPREMYVALIRFLERAGARSAAFDVLFTEQSSEHVADDQKFAQALTGSLPVVMAVALRSDLSRESAADVAAFTSLLTPPPCVGSSSFRGATLPVQELLVGHWYGNVTADPDSDGIFRRQSPCARFNGRAVPSLSLAALLAAGESPTPIPDQVVLRYHGGQGAYERISAIDVIQAYAALEEGQPPSLSLDTFKDAIVFVGLTAPGLLDLRPSPLDPRAPGVEINALAADNLLHRDGISETSSAYGVLLALALILLVISPALFAARFIVQIVWAVGVAICYVASSVVLLAHGIWIPLVAPLVAWGFSAGGAFAIQYWLEGRERRFMTKAFAHYVSPSVIQQIVDQPGLLKLGGERQELSIFFSDIAGFTTISESLTAEKVGALLNRFLTSMTDIILDEGGTVDKYVGDAIVAFWNAPLRQPDHAERSVRAAVRCQQKVEELLPELKKEFGVEVRMRMGIHTGMVSVGNFGSNTRFNYTIVGDAANLASRLEGANKIFGSTIMISKETRSQLSDAIAVRKLGTIQVVGRETPVAVYEPVLGTAPAWFSDFEAGVLQWEAGRRADAAHYFAALKDDPCAKKYLARYEKEGEKPDGVWRLLEK